MPGFNGISIQYIVSPKYQQYDAITQGLNSGIENVVWMNKGVKDRVGELLPQDFLPKIATEEDVTDINDLKKWLEEVDHPIVKTWAEALAEEEEEEEEWEAEGAMVPMGTIGMTIPGVGGAGGFKIILKNCKIKCDTLIIKRIDSTIKKRK